MGASRDPEDKSSSRALGEGARSRFATPCAPVRVTRHNSVGAAVALLNFMTKKQAHQKAKEEFHAIRRRWRMADGEGKPESVIIELKQKVDEAEEACRIAFKAYMESDE